jgi:hypothetical protein
MARKASVERKVKKLRLADPSKAARVLKLNKQRGYRMEKYVEEMFNRERELVSKRTPISGNGWLKGDNHILLYPAPQFFIISCKFSAGLQHDTHPEVKIQSRWFADLDRDVQAMRSIGSQFGILICKWHRKVDLLGVANVRDIERITELTGFQFQSEREFTAYQHKSFRVLHRDFHLLQRDIVFDNLHVVLFDALKLRNALVEKDKEMRNAK